ncbi:MAG: hypothetical protein QN229_03510 [Desulfurococcaceae archaeon TW002]
MLIRILNGAQLKLLKELHPYVSKDVSTYVFIGAPRIPLYHISTILKNFFIVTSKHDDIYVTKTARNLGVLLDANLINLGDYLIAGVGGIDPWHAISRLRELLSNQERKILLFSYFPAYNICDFMPELRTRLGLLELKDFLDYIKPSVFVCLSNVECYTRYGETRIYSLSKDTLFLDLVLDLI